jgi:hypothetical protein
MAKKKYSSGTQKRIKRVMKKATGEGKGPKQPLARAAKAPPKNALDRLKPTTIQNALGSMFDFSKVENRGKAKTATARKAAPKKATPVKKASLQGKAIKSVKQRGLGGALKSALSRKK